MLPEERVGASELAGDGYSGLVSTVHDTHRAIAGRVFGHVGEAGRPVELAHDAIAGVAYAATRAGGRSLLRLAGRGAALAAAPEASTIDRHPAGRIARGVLSGFVGDRLEADRNPLAVTMAVRVSARDVSLDRQALASAFPDASDRIAVFLHGLGETEDAWRLRARQRPTYGERLHDELGFTAVEVRYNTGLHVSENGRRLARLLTRLADEWPVEVTEIALIGHSMGGLVARSACHYGSGDAWARRVAHVVMLGTPHTGAPLERGAHALGWALSRLPETRPLARPLVGRSAGISDLGHGYLTDECWGGQVPDTLARHRARQLPYPDATNHYFVSASITADPEHPLGRRLGDLLVLRESAWGGTRQTERISFPVDHYRHLGGASHFDLLCHPAVADQLVSWFSTRPQLACGSVASGAEQR